MVGKTFTYLLGSDAAALLFNSKNEDLNAEDVYSRLTTPVFGKGVAYDVPNAVCIYIENEQKMRVAYILTDSCGPLALYDGLEILAEGMVWLRVQLDDPA